MFSVCVCVFGIYVLQIVVERLFWELKMLMGSLVELHAWLHSCFSLLEKLFLSNLDNFSTPPRHLAIYRAFQLPLITILIASGSMSFFIIFSVELFLNRSLTAASVEAFYAQHLSQRLYLSRFTELLYIHSTRSICHFAWHLSRSICHFTSQTSLTHSKLLSQGFFKLFEDFIHLVSF